jgi:membrane protein YdbS with pleckstrin-like domain
VILREPARELDPRVRTAWAIEGGAVAVALAFVVAAAVVALGLTGETGWALAVGVPGVLVVAAASVLLAVVGPRLEHRHFRFEVTDLGLYVASGWLWRRWQVVPHARVQTVDTTSGPLLRALGLVEVRVTTASAGGGTGIPGLRPREADALVEELARRAGVEEAT